MTGQKKFENLYIYVILKHKYKVCLTRMQNTWVKPEENAFLLNKSFTGVSTTEWMEGFLNFLLL